MLGCRLLTAAVYSLVTDVTNLASPTELYVAQCQVRISQKTAKLTGSLAPSARRFDRGSDILGQTESDLGSNVFITDAGLTEVFRNLQTTAERHSGKQRYLRRATLQLTTTALDGLPLLTEQI